MSQAALVPQTAPRSLEGLLQVMPFQLRMLVEKLGGLGDAERAMAWHKLKTQEERAQYALQLLQLWDQQNPGQAQPMAPAQAAVAPAAPPAAPMGAQPMPVPQTQMPVAQPVPQMMPQPGPAPHMNGVAGASARAPVTGPQPGPAPQQMAPAPVQMALTPQPGPVPGPVPGVVPVGIGPQPMQPMAPPQPGPAPAETQATSGKGKRSPKTDKGDADLGVEVVNLLNLVKKETEALSDAVKASGEKVLQAVNEPREDKRIAGVETALNQMSGTLTGINQGLSSLGQLQMLTLSLFVTFLQNQTGQSAEDILGSAVADGPVFQQLLQQAYQGKQ